MAGFPALAREEAHMSLDADLSTGPPTRSAAARMQAYRRRRRAGLRCIVVQIRATEIDELIRRKLLEADARNSPRAIRDALHAHFDRTLGTAR
jgi:hypothetical protein